MDKVLSWATAVWDTFIKLENPFDYFEAQIQEVFEYPAGRYDITVQLLHTSGTQ